MRRAGGSEELLPGRERRTGLHPQAPLRERMNMQRVGVLVADLERPGSPRRPEIHGREQAGRLRGPASDERQR